MRLDLFCPFFFFFFSFPSTAACKWRRTACVRLEFEANPSGSGLCPKSITCICTIPYIPGVSVLVHLVRGEVHVTRGGVLKLGLRAGLHRAGTPVSRTPQQVFERALETRVLKRVPLGHLQVYIWEDYE